LPSDVAALSEPLGCAINAIQQARVRPEDRVLIYGAGPVGLLLAMAVKAHQAHPFIQEIHPAKLRLTERFQGMIGIESDLYCKDTPFDVVINAAPSADTFLDGIPHLISGGTFCLFSGFTTETESPRLLSVLNEIHYRQLRVAGAYGCTRLQQAKGLEILKTYQNAVKLLIQEHIRLQDVPSVLSGMLAGEALKFVVELY
jgi:threonine dehydrogenase-like Zn-dependent dehydrogenase